MTKARELETIIETDQRNLNTELGLGGKFAVKSSGWNEIPGLPGRRCS